MFACKKKVLELDISRCFDDLHEEGWEEMLEHTSGCEEIYAAVDEWNKKNEKTLKHGPSILQNVGGAKAVQA